MRSRVTIFAVLTLCLVVIGAVSAGGPVHQVTAGGRLSLEDGTFETYGLVAQVDEAGVVTGQGEFHVHGLLSAHIEWNCLSISGNTAWLGGVVTRTDDPDVAPVGMDFTWQLQDNGQGANAPPDLQSFVLPTDLLPGFGLGDDCTDQGDLFFLGVFEWQAGNIQVR